MTTWHTVGSLDVAALDRLELALRRFIERGERYERHEELRADLQRLGERLHTLASDVTADPDLRRRGKTVAKLVDRAIKAMEFAGRLRSLRVERALSVDRLADLACINVSILYRLERGGFAPPSRRTLQRLAQALQVRMDDLAPTQRMGEQPVELEEAMAFAPRLDALSRDERFLLHDLIDWWLLRRPQYLVLGPMGRGQEQTMELAREIVRVLGSDAESIRELRAGLLRWVMMAKEDDLRRIGHRFSSAAAPNGREAADGWRA